LAAFAYLLTRVDLALAGRHYAASRGIYIAASLAWLWTVEGRMPDGWGLMDAIVCLVCASIILLGPRPAV
jgi:small multidrug resistance family-3 protein